MAHPRFAPLLLALAAVLGAAPSVHAGEPLIAGRLEASAYSLPNVLATAEWKVEPDGVLLAESPNPTLTLPWRTAVHASGAKAEIEYTVRVYSDRGFPANPEEDWHLEWEDHRVLHATGKPLDDGPGFDRSGDFAYALPVNFATPVRRYRVQARLKVKNQLASVLVVRPSQAEETTVERSFFVAVRPRWKESRHQTDALIRALLLASGRVRGLRAWTEYAGDVRRGAASPDESATFGSRRILSILDRMARLATRQVSDPELRQAARTLVDESRKLTSSLPDKNAPALRTPSGGGDYGHVARELMSRARESIATATPALPYLQTFQSAAEAVQLQDRLEQLLDAAARESETLQSLWSVGSAVDLAEVLARYDKALASEQAAIAVLGRALERELGRNYKARAWSKLEDSPLYKNRVPKRAPGDRRKTAGLARTILQGLYYFLKAERYRVAVLANATASGLAPIRDIAQVTLPDFDDELTDYPVDLQVKLQTTAALTEAGGVVEYPMTIRHAGNRPREVRVQYAELKLPGGWHRRLTDTAFTLKPGQTKRVVYAVSTPKTAREPENVRTGLLVYYADQPAARHDLALLTRMSAQGRLLDVMGPAWDQPDRLAVRSLDSEDHIFPGQIATYRFLVRHDGSTRRGVRARLVGTPPKGFIARVSPERAALVPGREEEFLLKVTAPLTARSSSHVDWQVAIGYEDELTDPERVRVRTSFTGLTVLRSRPVVNRGKVVTYHLSPGQSSQRLVAENRGNESDTFDLTVSQPAEGWFVDFPSNHVVLSPEHPAAAVAFRASAPRFAEGGAFTHVEVKMTSANHPEVVTTATLTLVKHGGDQVLVRPLERRVLIAPGQTRRIAFVARNRSEGPVELAFRADPRNPLPEALDFDGVPLQRLEPEAELEMEALVELPAGLDYRPGQIVPVGIAGFDALGGLIVKGATELVVAPQHAVHLSIRPGDARRSPGLLIVRLTVRNTGTVAEEFVLFLTGKRRTWGRLSRNRVTLEAGHETHVTLYVRVPAGVQHGQAALLEIQAKSTHNSSARSFVRVDVAP